MPPFHHQWAPPQSWLLSSRPQPLPRGSRADEFFVLFLMEGLTMGNHRKTHRKTHGKMVNQWENHRKTHGENGGPLVNS